MDFNIYSTDPSGNSITFDRDARSLNDIPRLKRQSKQIFTMEQYTPRERSEIVEIYIQQNKSIVKTQRAFKKLKNVKSAPSKNTIKNFWLVRLFLIRRGQIKVDQGDRPRILLPYEPVLRGPQEHPKNAVLSSCAWNGPKESSKWPKMTSNFGTMSDEAHFTLNGTVNKQNCRSASSWRKSHSLVRR